MVGRGRSFKLQTLSKYAVFRYYFCALVCLMICIQCYQPSFYYLGKYEYQDVKSFLQGKGRCKYNPYKESDTLKEKPEEKTPCRILLKDTLPGIEWYEVASHHIQYYGYGAKHNFNLSTEQCFSEGYRKLELLILCEGETVKSQTTCTNTAECGEREFCHKLPDLQQNLCIPLPKLNESCDDILQCESGECREADRKQIQREQDHKLINNHSPHVLNFNQITNSVNQDQKILYEECERNDQCTGTQNAGLCKEIGHRKLCWCNNGYIADLDSLKCLKANKKIQEECDLNEQCTATKNANTCQKMHQNTTGKCTCSDQFVFIHGKCLKTGRHVNETCENHEQCNGTLNAGVCMESGGHSVCTCDQGFLKVIGGCVKERKRLGESCQVNLQCNGTEKAGVCGENYTCTCNEGFIRVQEDCLPDKRQLNELCEAHVQCSGTKDAGWCGENYTCTCNKGFVRIPLQENCLPGNLLLGQACTHALQCTGTENGGRCLNGECFCEEDFVLQRFRCLPDRRRIDETCEAHVQCSGTTNAGVCGEHKTCTCDVGFIKILKEDCAPGNLSLGQTCTHNLQCTGYENGGRCLEGECFCEEGFVLQRLRCLPGNLSLGQTCTHDSQCTGTENGGRCLNGECFCEEGFLLQRLRCLPDDGSSSWITEFIGKENQIFYVIGASIIGTIVLYSAVLLAMKGRKSDKKRFSPNNSQSEPMKNIEYSLAEGIELQCMQEAQGCSEDYYSFPIDDVYSELHQKEKERETGNIYDSSHPQRSHRNKDSDNYIYSYNHLHEKPLDNSENVYDISNPVSLSSFVQNQ